MTERKINWPEYRQFCFGPQLIVLCAVIGVPVGLTASVLKNRAPDWLPAFVIAILVLAAALFAGPRLLMWAINVRIRDAWEKNEIGARLEPGEARAKIVAAPGAFVLRYYHLVRGRVHFGTMDVVGGWSSFVLEEKATGRRWAVRFTDDGRLLGIGALWERAGAQVELKRNKGE